MHKDDIVLAIIFTREDFSTLVHTLLARLTGVLFNLWVICIMGLQGHPQKANVSALNQQVEALMTSIDALYKV